MFKWVQAELGFEVYPISVGGCPATSGVKFQRPWYLRGLHQARHIQGNSLCVVQVRLRRLYHAPEFCIVTQLSI